MFLTPSFIVLSAVASTIHAARLPLQARTSQRLDRRAPANSSVSVGNSENLSYFVNMTVGGQVYSTLIDTGSNDMWIYANVSNTTPTGVQDAGLQYGTGSVVGYIYNAPLSFAGYDVPSQAFVEIQNITSYGQDPRASNYTALVGLGPYFVDSTVYALLNGSDAALPMMLNIFKQNMTSENYITLLLPRLYDPESTAFGEMTISELVPGREAVANQTKLPIAALTNNASISQAQHWMTVTDLNGIIGPSGQPINITTKTSELASPVAGNGRLVGIFDSGYSLAQVPSALAEAIYSGVQGAHLAPYEGQSTWFVPCDAELNMTLVFGGQKVFIHPLDMVITTDGNAINATSTCVGAFQPSADNSSVVEYDAIWGMPFFCNAYLLLDFGDLAVESSMDRKAPFIQMLATTNATDAHNDFVNVHNSIGNSSSSPSSSAGSTSAAVTSYTLDTLSWQYLYVAAGLLAGIGALL